MKSVSRFVVPALFAVMAATSAANAQGAQPAQPNAPAADARMRARPSPETMQRLQDGRIAMIKATLKLTDAQQKLWQPVEDLMKARQASRQKAMQDRLAATQGGTARPSLSERMDRRSAGLAKAAENAKAFSAVFKPFYDSLSDSQKAAADPLFARMNGGQRMHGGHRWASHRGMQQ